MPNALIYHQPKTACRASSAWSSAWRQHCCTQGGLAEFTDEVVNRPAVQEMIRRVQFGVNPVARRRGTTR